MVKMKKIIAILIIIMINMIYSCGPSYEDVQREQLIDKNAVLGDNGDFYSIIIIDSCEYIYENGGNASWGSHKGNCKFCKERLKNGK